MAALGRMDISWQKQYVVIGNSNKLLKILLSPKVETQIILSIYVILHWKMSIFNFNVKLINNLR